MMGRQFRLAIISHKVCWHSSSAASGFASDGGFPLQVSAISALFAQTEVVVPVSAPARATGEVPVDGCAVTITALRALPTNTMRRRLMLPFWIIVEGARIGLAIRRADVVYVPLPSDIGTIGIALALLMRRRLFVRYCGNWRQPRTSAQRLSIGLLERAAGEQIVVMATGADEEAPSVRNRTIEWIFSTSLSQGEIERMGKPRQLPRTRPLRLVIACRQDYRKGTAVVIDALAILNGKAPQLELHVAGDGPDLPAFRERAAKAGVSERVVFHGKLGHEGVLELLSECDLFCFPTQASEGFPKAVLEAMACGLPVVTTAVSALPTLVGQEAGVVVESAEPRAVASAIEHILRCERTYERMSEAAVRKASGYSMQAWAAAIERRLACAWDRVHATA